MAKTLLFGQDAHVASWMFEVSSCRPMQYHSAIGLLDPSGALVGGIMWTAYNGSDVELHYTGPRHLTRGIVRFIMAYALIELGVNRITVRTRKESMARGVLKLGAVYEGTVRRLYGPTDAPEHAGRQFAFFRETIEKLARTKGNH